MCHVVSAWIGQHGLTLGQMTYAPALKENQRGLYENSKISGAYIKN
jgi:hypothetical protein